MLRGMTWLAISFDLDDTLWPIAPVMQRAEQRLHAWLVEHCPRTAHAWPPEQLRALRDAVWHAHPALQHDYTATRLLCLREALLPHGYGEAEVQAAFAVFIAARNEVDLFPDVPRALRALAERYRLIAISNGNADLRQIGLGSLFEFSVHAREHGAAKPSPCIFAAAAEQLGLPAARILHVGDHPEHDVAGALAAGMGAVWLDRGLTRAMEPVAAPRVDDLLQLCAWLGTPVPP